MLSNRCLHKDRQQLCQPAQSVNGQHLISHEGQIGKITAVHGFSHWMVHIVGPYSSDSHSDVACVVMLTQAKWLEAYADEGWFASIAPTTPPPDEIYGGGRNNEQQGHA